VSGRLVGLHHVQLAAPPGSEDRLRWFYGEVLGMSEVRKPPVLAARGGAWFRSGALELHLGVEEGFRPARKAHLGIRVEDLEAIIARLASHGVEVDRDDDLPGFRRCYVADPHGNRLELLEPARSSTQGGPLPSAKRPAGSNGGEGAPHGRPRSAPETRRR
jgi:catechol 2,3-dioxygenase-like lactoylglutathione lyase family enzyme